MKARAFATFVSTVLAACAAGPDYSPPRPPEGAAAPFVSAGPAVAAGGEVADSWWRLYDDATLDAFVVEALKANQDLVTAEANLAASRAIYEGARAGRYPQTRMETAGVDGRDPTTEEILELTGRPPQSLWLFDSLIDVSYEVDLFGHVRRSVEAARDNSEAAAAARDWLRVTVAAETVRAYGQICTSGEQVAVAQRSLALASREEQIARRRREAGAGSDFDVVRAEQFTAQVGASIPPLQGQRRAALFQLAALLGRTPSKAPTEAEACAQAPHLGAPIPVGDGAALLRRRPDVRRADRTLAAALAGIGVATADLYPRVTLGAFYGGFTDQFHEIATNSALGWGIAPSVSWTFPNMAGPLARLHQAKAGAKAELSNFDSVVLQALKETEQALAAYSAELEHHAALATAQDKAQRAYDLAHGELEAGAISQLDLLTSEQTLVAATATVAASNAAIVQDQIGVFKALGGGWRQGADAARLAGGP